MVRVFVLMVDGLDYRDVQRYGLRYLAGARCGTYRACVSPTFGKPHTPSAWATIITGRPPEEHGIDSWWSWGRILDKLRFAPPFKWIPGKRRILNALGIRPRLASVRGRVTTVFDAVRPSVALFVPSYSEPLEPHDRLAQAFKRGVRSYVEEIWRVFRWRRDAILRAVRLCRRWRIFAAWIDIVDLLGHVCIARCKVQYALALRAVNELARMIREWLPDDAVFCVVSDHGMEPQPDGTGDYSYEGFWSIDPDVPWYRPRSATDFFDLWIELTKARENIIFGRSLAARWRDCGS